MLETVRIRREGYPVRYGFDDFVNRFSLIINPAERKPIVENKDSRKASADLVKMVRRRPPPAPLTPRPSTPPHLAADASSRADQRRRDGLPDRPNKSLHPRQARGAAGNAAGADPGSALGRLRGPLTAPRARQRNAWPS